MKSYVLFAAIACVVLFSADARAQEGSLESGEDARRTPVMAVDEHALPVIKPAAVEAKKPQDSNTKKGAKAPAKDVKTEPAGPVAPPPMVTNDARQTVVSEGFVSTGDAKLDELIKQSAARNGIDPNLVVAVMRQESGFKQYARSYKGATGLMQLMPATARRFGVNNIYDPAENIEGGSKYLRFLLDKFNGDVKLALAGYNAGEGAVVNYGYNVPPYRETRNYVSSISARYGRDKHAAGNKKQVAAAPKAPEAMTFTGGTSSRLSNNY
jgi:soluble lytic murein transglycosylase-like protein